jgi:hypothetical protein
MRRFFYTLLGKSFLAILFASFGQIHEAASQINPPGYERQRQIQQAMLNTPILDRDTITVIDTTLIFDPNTYEEETKIIISKYSLRDYCKAFLGIQDPDILLDRKPHKIVDPRTYEDMIILLNEAGKLDTIPK